MHANTPTAEITSMVKSSLLSTYILIGTNEYEITTTMEEELVSQGIVLGSNNIPDEHINM